MIFIELNWGTVMFLGTFYGMTFAKKYIICSYFSKFVVDICF